jgi:hypothetical protein
LLALDEKELTFHIKNTFAGLVMNLLFTKRICWTGLFLVSACFIFAQENDLYGRLFKESISVNRDFLFAPAHRDLFNDSVLVCIELDATQNYLPTLGFNYKQNSLYLHFKDSLPENGKWTVSPYLTASYTNQDLFDPLSTETAGDILANGVLMPLLSIATLKPAPLILYLMQIGALSDEPFVPKESRKQKALREIKTVYGTDW